MAYRLLPKFFAPEEICPCTSYDTLLALPAAERARYRLFHGHFNTHLGHFVPGNLRLLTLLRHPFERAISQYRYILSSPSHPLHHPVKAERGFGAYLRNRALFGPNSLTLALGTTLDPDAVLRQAALRGLPPGGVDAILDEETFHLTARAEHEDAAKALLDSCALVGLQEEMTRTAALLHRHFGLPVTGPVESMNETRAAPLSRADLPQAVLDDLAALHEHDLAVYAHGQALFERQCRGAPHSEIAAPAIRRPRPAPPRLYFMNLPWADDIQLGSQLLHGLHRSSAVCPAWNYDGLAALPAEELPRYRAFHGHFFWPLAEIVGAPLATIAFLTDPVERAALQYRERLADRGHKLNARIGAKRGLGDFVTDPGLFTPNVLTLSFARRFSPRELARLAARARRRGTSLNDELGDYIALHPATPADLARAKRRLAHCAFLGLAESFDTSLAALGRLLDWPNIDQALTQDTRHRMSARAIVSPADRAVIAEVNDLDTALYGYARSLVREPRPVRAVPLVGRLFGRPALSGGVASRAPLR